MLLINSFIVLLIPLTLGLFLLSLFLQKGTALLNLWEKLALAFSLGLGYLTILMFLLAILKIPLTLLNISASVFLTALTAYLYLRKKKTFCLEIKEIKNSFTLRLKNLSVVEYVLFFMLCLKVFYVFFEALIKPLIDVDAFQFYSIVAKGVFYKNTFLNPYLLHFIKDKPLFPYLSQGWVLLGLQTVDDALLKILTPVLFLCLLIIFYSVLRRYYSKLYSLLFTFLLSTLPFLVFHAATAYADFPQTFYYAVGTIYLFLFMKEWDLQHKENAFTNLTLSLLFLAISVWVKRAGLFLAGIDIFVLFVYLLANRKFLALKNFIAPALIFIVTVAPWVIYGQAETLVRTFKKAAEGASSQAALTANPLVLEKTDIVFSAFLRKLFLYADWHLLWILFIFAVVFFYRKAFSKPLIFLLLIIILDISALFIQFRFGESFAWLLDGTLLDRLVMNYVPVVLYFSAEVILSSYKHD